MKSKKYDRDVDECAEKLWHLLSEYGCFVEWDSECDQVILVDRHNNDFVAI